MNQKVSDTFSLVDHIGSSAKGTAADIGAAKDTVAANADAGAGAATADKVGALAHDAGVLGRNSLESVTEAVSKRPLTAIAVAAGVGLLLGMMSRPGAGR